MVCPSIESSTFKIFIQTYLTHPIIFSHVYQISGVRKESMFCEIHKKIKQNVRKSQKTLEVKGSSCEPIWFKSSLLQTMPNINFKNWILRPNQKVYQVGYRICLNHVSWVRPFELNPSTKHLSGQLKSLWHVYKCTAIKFYRVIANFIVRFCWR